MSQTIINILHKIMTALNPEHQQSQQSQEHQQPKEPISATDQKHDPCTKMETNIALLETKARPYEMGNGNGNMVCVGMDSKRVPSAPPPFRVFGSHHSLRFPSLSRKFSTIAQVCKGQGLLNVVCIMVPAVLLSSCIGSKTTVKEAVSDSICNDYKSKIAGLYVENICNSYKDSLLSWSRIDLQSLINGHESIIYREVEELSTDSTGSQHNRRERIIEVSRELAAQTTSTATDSTLQVASGLTASTDSAQIQGSQEWHGTMTHEAERSKDTEIEAKSLTESIVPKDIIFAIVAILILLLLIIRKESGNPYTDL